MFEMLWNEFLERFDVVDFGNQVQNQSVVDNHHVPSRTGNIVEVDRYCLVKFVKTVNVTLSGLYIPVSLLRKTQVDKSSYCSHTL